MRENPFQSPATDEAPLPAAKAPLHPLVRDMLNNARFGAFIAFVAFGALVVVGWATDLDVTRMVLRGDPYASAPSWSGLAGPPALLVVAATVAGGLLCAVTTVPYYYLKQAVRAVWQSMMHRWSRLRGRKYSALR